MLEPATSQSRQFHCLWPFIGMDKPVLTSVPLRYTFGTHSAVALSPSGAALPDPARHKAFSCHSRHSDEQLFNLHLKCIAARSTCPLAHSCCRSNPPLEKPRRSLRAALWPREESPRRLGAEESLRWRSGAWPKSPPVYHLEPSRHRPHCVDRGFDGHGSAAEGRGGQQLERVRVRADAMLPIAPQGRLFRPP